MPNIIDAFLMTLDLDASGFKSGVDEAERTQNRLAEVSDRTSKEIQGDIRRTSEASTKQAKDMVSGQKVVSEGFTKLRDTAIGMLAVFAAGKGIGDFVANTTSADAAAGRLATNLGMNVQALGAWELAVQQVGGTSADAESSLKSLVNASENLKYGRPLSPEMQGALMRLGITSPSALQDPNQAMIQIMEALHKQKPADAQLLGQAIGLSPAMVNLAIQFGGNIQQLLAQMAKLAPTAGESKEAQDRQAAFNTLDTTLTEIGRELLHDVNPYLKDFLGTLQQIADWGVKHPGMFAAAAGAASVVTGAAGASMLKKAAAWLLGRGGPGAAAEAAEATEAAGVVAAGGSVVLSPALLAALGVYASNALGEPGIDPNESAELHKLFPNAPQGTPATADRTLPPVAQSLLNSIGGSEAPGGYNELYGGGTFSGNQFPDWAGKQVGTDANGNPIMTHAAGRYQFEPGTWAEAQKALNLPDFSPKSQDQAAWWLAQRDYRSRTGRDLLTDLRAHDPKVDALIQKTLGPTWTSLLNRSSAEFAKSLDVPASGSAPATPPPPSGVSPATERVLTQLRTIAAPKAPLMQHAGMYQSALTARWVALNPPASPSTTHAETHVTGPITINTKATDAAGIAKSLKGALAKYSYVDQANRGLA